MNHYFIKIFFVFTINLLALNNLYADTPVIIDDLFTDKGKLKMDLSLTYSNSENKNPKTTDSILIQTGDTSFISVPTRIGENQVNTDSFIWTVGLRYGLTKNTELYGRTSFVNNNIKTWDSSSHDTINDSYFYDTWIGVSHQIKNDDKTPALLVFGEVALQEKEQFNYSSLRSSLIGLTTYKLFDPIILSTTISYRINTKRKDGDFYHKPSDFITITPVVSFAVNDKFTLINGFQWMSKYESTYNNKLQSLVNNETSLIFGLGYIIRKGSSINFTFKANVSGRSMADMRLNWLHTFQ